jgi:hypothetical protein
MTPEQSNNPEFPKLPFERAEILYNTLPADENVSYGRIKKFNESGDSVQVMRYPDGNGSALSYRVVARKEDVEHPYLSANIDKEGVRGKIGLPPIEIVPTGAIAGERYRLTMDTSHMNQEERQKVATEIIRWFENSVALEGFWNTPPFSAKILSPRNT